MTIEGASDPAQRGRQLVHADFHPQTQNIGERLLIDPTKKGGELSYTLQAPGDITRMNILTHYRARDKRGGWDVQVSFDNGQTFRSVSQCEGGRVAFGNYVEVNDVPAGSRSVVVRWVGTTGYNATMIFNHRNDADYKLAHAGFRPVKITYVWDEDGVPKKDEHVARQPSETYQIHCAGKPSMKSIILELAP